MFITQTLSIERLARLRLMFHQFPVALRRKEALVQIN
jgi:hypothetical protein